MLFFYLASCDYLDKAPEAAGLDFEKVFGDSANYYETIFSTFGKWS